VRNLLADVRGRWLVTPSEELTQSYRDEAVRIRRGDRLSWLLLMSGFVPLALQNLLLAPLWIALLAGGWLARRRGLAIQEEQVGPIALVAAIAGFAYFGAGGRPVWAFSLFLILASAVLVFKADLVADVQRLYLVAFVLFLVFSALTLEYSFLVVLFLMVMSGTMVMLRYHFPEEVRAGRYVAVARTLAGPVLAAVAVSVPIFVVFPRVPVATLNLTAPPQTGGFAEEVRFGTMRATLESDRLFMTARTPGPHRWRGIVHDFYSGSGWKATRGPARELRADIGQPISLDPEMIARDARDRETAEVILEPTAVRYLFAPRFPLELELDLSEIRRDQARTLLRIEDPQNKRVRYVVRFGEAAALESEGFLREKYLQLPPGLPARIGDLARQVTARARTDRERAEILERHLAEGEFTYTLDVTIPRGRHPMEHFLFESRAGYCEYFSSAMALMLRTLGVPSRVVNGFNPGTFEPYSGTWAIRERNAHSWVEAYLGRREGWVEFDPTTGRGRPEVLALAARLGLSDWRLYQLVAGLMNRFDFEWQRWVVSFSASMQWGLIGWLSKMYEDAEIALRVWWQQLRLGRPGLVATAGFGFFTLAATVLWPLRRRLARAIAWFWSIVEPVARVFRRLIASVLRRRRPRAPGEDAFYQELLALLARDGLVKQPGETPWELAARARSKRSEPIERDDFIQLVTDAYYEVAYRGRSLDPAGADRVARALVAVKQGACP
jgi:transglutaminase-like putative cysteine protease